MGNSLGCVKEQKEKAAGKKAPLSPKKRVRFKRRRRGKRRAMPEAAPQEEPPALEVAEDEDEALKAAKASPGQEGGEEEPSGSRDADLGALHAGIIVQVKERFQGELQKARLVPEPQRPGVAGAAREEGTTVIARLLDNPADKDCEKAVSRLVELQRSGSCRAVLLPLRAGTDGRAGTLLSPASAVPGQEPAPRDAWGKGGSDEFTSSAVSSREPAPRDAWKGGSSDPMPGREPAPRDAWKGGSNDPVPGHEPAPRDAWKGGSDEFTSSAVPGREPAPRDAWGKGGSNDPVPGHEPAPRDAWGKGGSNDPVPGHEPAPRDAWGKAGSDDPTSSTAWTCSSSSAAAEPGTVSELSTPSPMVDQLENPSVGRGSGLPSEGDGAGPAASRSPSSLSGSAARSSSGYGSERPAKGTGAAGSAVPPADGGLGLALEGRACRGSSGTAGAMVSV
ncbi:uncharacterized protein RBU47_013784 [Passerculus sandwichensis]